MHNETIKDLNGKAEVCVKLFSGISSRMEHMVGPGSIADITVSVHPTEGVAEDVNVPSGTMLAFLSLLQQGIRDATRNFMFDRRRMAEFSLAIGVTVDIRPMKFNGEWYEMADTTRPQDELKCAARSPGGAS